MIFDYAGARIPFVPYDSTGRSSVPTALAAARGCLAPGLPHGDRYVKIRGYKIAHPQADL